MNSVVILLVSIVFFIIAYCTYGRFLSKKIFQLNFDKTCPSKELEDNVDFVPTRRSVLFGHHFTSIAGTGPIVGPAIAVIWGWMPAFIWVLFGSVIIGAVHDFGSLVVSIRNKGRSIGDISADLINSRVRLLFLLIIFFALWIVIAIFGVVIAAVFSIFPASVFPVWVQIPIAVALGHMVYNKNFSPLKVTITAVFLMYLSIVIGAYLPFNFEISTSTWVIILLIYAYIASILPVQKLLQPRDYINAYQLFIAMVLLCVGIFVYHPNIVAPNVNLNPEGAPDIFPMLFMVVACGAISGFHSLVASGTSSKQCLNEKNARSIGYGSMLIEGFLAVIVIIACTAGLGSDAFTNIYSSWANASGLGTKINAFVIGSSNIIQSIGIPEKITLAIMGVFVASFAATTLDTSTRLQRYTVSEIAKAFNINFLSKKHPATFIAVASALLLAFSSGNGKGALVLWALFGSINQLLAGLALLVVTIYLAHRKLPLKYTLIPMAFMFLMTGWAMIINLSSFFLNSNWLLFSIGLVIFLLEVWIIFEGVGILVKNSINNIISDKIS